MCGSDAEAVASIKDPATKERMESGTRQRTFMDSSPHHQRAHQTHSNQAYQTKDLTCICNEHLPSDTSHQTNNNNKKAQHALDSWYAPPVHTGKEVFVASLVYGPAILCFRRNHHHDVLLVGVRSIVGPDGVGNGGGVVLRLLVLLWMMIWMDDSTGSQDFLLLFVVI